MVTDCQRWCAGSLASASASGGSRCRMRAGVNWRGGRLVGGGLRGVARVDGLGGVPTCRWVWVGWGPGGACQCGLGMRADGVTVTWPGIRSRRGSSIDLPFVVGPGDLYCLGHKDQSGPGPSQPSVTRERTKRLQRILPASVRASPCGWRRPKALGPKRRPKAVRISRASSKRSRTRPVFHHRPSPAGPAAPLRRPGLVDHLVNQQRVKSQ